MRTLFLIIFFLLFSLKTSFLGQVAQAYEVGKEPKDKVLISGGKPVFIIAISPNLASDNFITNREKSELSKNFSSLNPDVRVEYTNVIIFKNNNIKKFDFQKSDESLERVFYWDGDVDSQPIVHEGLMNATEFFAQELNFDVVSSYNVDFEKLKLDYLTPPKEKITKKSKEVSDLFLNKTVMSYLFYFDKGSENLYKMNFKGVKSIKAVPSKSGKDVIPMEITFNEDGLPVNMNYTLEKKVKTFDFQYENGLVRKFNDEGEFYYVDNKMIEIKGGSRTIYEAKDGNYLISKYETFLEDSKNIFWREIDIEKNRILYKEKGGLNDTTYEMTSRENVFPVIHRVAHSEKDNIIEKKGLEIIEKYLPDNKIFNWTFNTKGLIEKASFNDLDAKKKIEITYLYEYYK